MGQVSREAQPTRGLTNLDSVPLNVIVSKHFHERSFHQRKKKWQTTVVNNLPWQIIFKPLIWTVILFSIIICFVNKSAYPNSQVFSCWWKWGNVGQRERVTSLPFWKSGISSYSDEAACVSIDTSLALPQQHGRTRLKNAPLPSPMKVSPVSRGPCSAAQRGTRGAAAESEPQTRPAVPGQRGGRAPGRAPGAATPDTGRATFGGGSCRSAARSPQRASPLFFSEPDGAAFGFSFKHVTFVRRIKRAGTALGRSGKSEPCSARGNHIKARGCAFGGRA